METKDDFKVGDFVWLTFHKTWGKINYKMSTSADVLVGGNVEMVPYAFMNRIFNSLCIGDNVLYEGEEYKVEVLTAPYFVTGMTQVKLWSPETLRTVWTTYTQVERIAEIVAVAKQEKLEDYCESIYSADAEPQNDPVKQPQHYLVGGLEVKAVLKAKLSPEEYRGFCKGNVLKYLMRAEHKGSQAQDYEKAAQYTGWLTEKDK